jgi:hypothetical protein
MDVSSAVSVDSASAQNAQSLMMLAKVFQAQKQEGQAALRLIEQAPVGAPEPGKGERVDARA